MNDLAPVTGTTRRYLNLAVALLLAAATITFILLDKKPQVAMEEPLSTGEPLFRVGSEQIHVDELALEFQEPLYQIRKMAHEQQMLVLEEALVEHYILQEMAGSGEDRATVLTRLFADAVPSAEAQRTFYRANQQSDTPPFAQIQEEIAHYLMEQNRQSLKQTLLARLLVQGEAEILMEAPQPPVDP